MTSIVNLVIGVPHHVQVKAPNGDVLPDQDAVSWTLTHSNVLNIQRSGDGWDLIGQADGATMVQMTDTSGVLAGGSFMAVVGDLTGLMI